MYLKDVEKVFEWLVENFKENFEYTKEENFNTNVLKASIYDENYGWETHSFVFNKQGKIIPNYVKQLELKQKIEQLQEELKELQKEN